MMSTLKNGNHISDISCRKWKQQSTSEKAGAEVIQMRNIKNILKTGSVLVKWNMFAIGTFRYKE